MPYSETSAVWICDNCRVAVPGGYNHRPDGWIRFLPEVIDRAGAPVPVHADESIFCSKACRDALAVTKRMDAEDTAEKYIVTVNGQSVSITPGRLSSTDIAAVQRVCQAWTPGVVTLVEAPQPVPQKR